MRRLTFALLFSFALASPTWAATYCWNPLSTGHAWTDSVWSATTCNPAVAGTSGPPTASDTAIFSSLDTSPVTISSAAVALNVSFTDTLGYTGTVSGTSTLAISGSLTLSSGVVWNYTGAITFNATSTGFTITTAGIVFNNNVVFNGTGGGWTNQDNWANGSGDTITLTAGTWNTNAKTITTGLVSITGTTTRTLTLTNSTVNLTNSQTPAGNVVWNAGTVTGLTSTLTGSTINGTGLNQTFTGGSLTYPKLSMTGGGAMSIGTSTFGTLTVVGITSGFPYALDNEINVGTWTVTGTLTLTGFSQADRLHVVDATSVSSQRTLTAAAVVLTNVDFQRIVGAGAATWSGTSVANWGDNTNISFTAAATLYWIGGSGYWEDPTHWSASSGGSAGSNVPLAQDSAIFDANSFTAPGQTLDLDYAGYSAFDMSAVTNSPTVYFDQGGNFFGSITLASSVQTLGHGADSIYTFQNATGTATLTTNGVSLPIGLSQIVPGGTVSLGSDLTLTTAASAPGSLTISGSTFTANNHNVTLGTTFASTGSTVRAVTVGTGIWTIQGASGTIWNISGTGLTFSGASGKILVDAASPGATRTFAGDGLTYNNFEWANENAASTLIFTGANTFADFKVDPNSPARTLELPASTTQTATTAELSGESDALLGLISSSGGTQATISVASGTVICDYCSIQDSAATGGAAFYAVQSTNVSNNTGWTFGDVPGTGGLSNMLLLGVGQ